MGSYARFEHYLTTLEVETCPEFWPPSPVSGPLCSRHGGNKRLSAQSLQYRYVLLARDASHCTAAREEGRSLTRRGRPVPVRMLQRLQRLQRLTHTSHPNIGHRPAHSGPETGEGGQDYERVSTFRVVEECSNRADDPINGLL